MALCDQSELRMSFNEPEEFSVRFACTVNERIPGSGEPANAIRVKNILDHITVIFAESIVKSVF